MLIKEIVCKDCKFKLENDKYGTCINELCDKCQDIVEKELNNPENIKVIKLK